MKDNALVNDPNPMSNASQLLSDNDNNIYVDKIFQSLNEIEPFNRSDSATASIWDQQNKFQFYVNF